MSLVQHVTQQEGTDRDEALVDVFLSPIKRLHSRHEAYERRPLAGKRNLEYWLSRCPWKDYQESHQL